MTREEAIKILEQRFDSSCRNNLFQNVEKLDYENALWMAISALRSATREQVEKVCRGEWLNFYNDFSTAECSKCGELFEVSPDETPKEEFFKAFKEFYHFCPSCGAPMTDDTWKEDIDALEFALTALRSMQEAGEPLSLEQLREMDGKPVWLHTFSSKSKKTNIAEWALVASSGEYSVSFVRVAVCGRTEKRCEDYGKTWIAYPYPPAHIDRSKWTAKNVTDQHPVDQFICSECGTILEDFSLCKIDEDSGDKTYYEYELKFCPACGRAITEAAWAELERRVRG